VDIVKYTSNKIASLYEKVST